MTFSCSEVEPCSVVVTLTVHHRSPAHQELDHLQMAFDSSVVQGSPAIVTLRLDVPATVQEHFRYPDMAKTSSKVQSRAADTISYLQAGLATPREMRDGNSLACGLIGGGQVSHRFLKKKEPEQC